MQTLASYLPQLIGDDGSLPLPAGSARTGWIDARDIAASAAAILIDPAPTTSRASPDGPPGHGGASCNTPSTATVRTRMPLTADDIAEIINLGHAYNNAVDTHDADAWTATFVDGARCDPGVIPLAQAEQRAEMQNPRLTGGLLGCEGRI